MSAVTLGALRLTDSAPLIVAQEFGFFAEEGLDARLSLEPSWANVADKLAHGALDAAAILPPLAFAVTLGARGPAEPLAIPYALSTGGNTITLATEWAARQRGRAREIGALAARAEALRARPGAVLGVVHEYSTHSLLLRYGLAAQGAEAGRDYQLEVAPPERSVEALRAGRIAGFCAGSPWGEVAARARVGATVATTHAIWRNAPEKALAVRERWALAHPEALAALLRALYRAAQFCDAPENASYVASLLSRRAYLGLDSHAILSSLPGTQGAQALSRFFAGAATFPWASQGLWFLTQMRRWGLIEAEAPLRDIAARVYRPDLYAQALAPLGAAIPRSPWKPEGGHAEAWVLPEGVEMGPDVFCDRAVFDPEAT
jgi:NitT/TauT family transport system ATP-binding protein/nitrate/nitrite transport system substrate-binding protein